MRKLVIASAAALALTGIASAETIVDPDTLSITVSGDVEELCSITATNSDIEIGFGTLSGTDTQFRQDVPFGIVCNSAEGATLGLSSANGGKMLRGGTETGDGNEIPYQVNPDPGSDAFSTTPGTPPTSLSSPKSYNINPDFRLREGREFGIAVFFDGVKGPDFQGAPTTTVWAGEYLDTITVSLTAN